MKSKLEEKKNEFLVKLKKELDDRFTHSGVMYFQEQYSVGKHFALMAFDAGVAAYKKMLEGEYPESRSVYACRLILAEAKLQQQAEKIESLEARVKEVESDLTHALKHLVSARDGRDKYFNELNLLESRLKEAESVIGFYTDPRNYESGQDNEAWRGRVVIGKLARQYMEKVK